MKKIFYFLLFVANLSYAQNVPYILTATNEPYAHIDEDANLLTDTLGEYWDDGLYEEMLDQPFELFDNEFSYLEMEDFNLGFYESIESDISAFVFPQGEDMIDKKYFDELGDHSLVYMKQSGEAGSRLIELELVEGAFYDDESNDISLTTLYASVNESNGVITYHYGPKSGSFDPSIFFFGNPLAGVIQRVDVEEENYLSNCYFIVGEGIDAELTYVESISENDVEEDNILSEYTLDAYPEEGTKYVLSPMSSATVDNDLLSVNVYPNPTVSQVQIIGMSEQATVRVYALDGSLLKHSKSATLDLSTFKNGVYMIEVVDGTNRYVSKIEKID